MQMDWSLALIKNLPRLQASFPPLFMFHLSTFSLLGAQVKPRQSYKHLLLLLLFQCQNILQKSIKQLDKFPNTIRLQKYLFVNHPEKLMLSKHSTSITGA